MKRRMKRRNWKLAAINYRKWRLSALKQRDEALRELADYQEANYTLQRKLHYEKSRLPHGSLKEYRKLIAENEFLRGRLGELPPHEQSIFDSQQPVMPLH